MNSEITIYCDEVSEELLAAEWLTGTQGFGSPVIKRLPTLSAASKQLKPLLEWERQDWVIADDERILCTIEFSRHGYTGDNGFQRFARLYKAAQLGIPNIYFTPFSRSRRNELDEGLSNERNAAPELFKTLMSMSEVFQVPCLALAWPTDNYGTPLPFTSGAAKESLTILRQVITYLSSTKPRLSNHFLRPSFPSVIEKMEDQANLYFRGSETRGTISLPVDIFGRRWIEDFLPTTYFQYGKADKSLASLALNMLDRRELQAKPQDPYWKSMGKSRILFLGYQWRPDPTCGLIALAAAQQLKDERLVVVWPRVFLSNGPERKSAHSSLVQFKKSGQGPLRAELVKLGFSSERISEFRGRVNVSANQFGIFTPTSKPGRILRDCRALVIFGDGSILYE